MKDNYQEKHIKDQNIHRYSMVVEYLGAGYAGSQRQPDQKTIQSEIESALSIITRTNMKVIFSGRTDRGVNARAQVVHFDLSFDLDNENKFLNSINGILPPDISVKLVKKVDFNFHSQKSAKFRWYRYKINNRAQRSVWLTDSIHIRQELDVERMNKALSFIKGNHDFSSFKNSNSDQVSPVCRMIFAECKKESDVIYIDLVATRFLYNMVRIIVGTLIDIGKGKYPAEHMLNVLKSKNRNEAGVTAKAEGLTFMMVGYDKMYNLNSDKEAMCYENILSKAS